MLAAKLAALVFLRFWFFSPAQEPNADSAATSRHLIRTRTIDQAAHVPAATAPERNLD
jgi:hypothetical protein